VSEMIVTARELQEIGEGTIEEWRRRGDVL